MIITPKIRGFICTTTHPLGCAANIKQQINYVKQQTGLIKTKLSPKVLIIGASTGYGLASRIVAAFGLQAQTLGVFFERSASEARMASPGWYNSQAFEREAAQAGLYTKSINGDAFSNEIKQQVIDIINSDWQGKVDVIIYSLAAPKRRDPVTGEIYSSVLKPIGEAYTNKTLDFLNGMVSSITFVPANVTEVLHTEKVMGGEDWELWIDELIKQNLLASGALTLAYSYIGPEITYPVYHHGTIGRAKMHLDRTARRLDQKLQDHCQGRALISVNKGLVTQASAAIPVVPLYLSLLYKVMKQKQIHEGCIEQIYRLFATKLYGAGITNNTIPVDAEHRIRIDDWELRDDVQSEVAELWQQVTTENLTQLADLDGYRKEFLNLFGFDVAGIDYQQEVEVAEAVV